MVKQNRVIDRFKEMVALDSPSLDERLVCDYIKNYLKSLGIDAEEDNAGEKLGGTTGNLYAYLDGQGEPLMFAAHMDTVEPAKGKVAVVHEDGTVTSKGDTVLGSDDLAGVNAILEALTVIKENNLPHRPIELVFTVSEETHCGGVAYFDFDKLKSKGAYVFDMDGEVGTAASSAPSILSYTVKFHGKSAHAGFAAHLGVHAIKAAALAVTRIPCGSLGDGVSANVGIIEGGKATNIVPDLCSITGEIRCFNDDDIDAKYQEVLDICSECADEFGASIEEEHHKHIKAFAVPDSHEVVKHFKACCERLGFTGECYPTFGGSDNNVFCEHGIDGIVVATAMNNCHATNEFTTVEGLTNAARLALELMKM